MAVWLKWQKNIEKQGSELWKPKKGNASPWIEFIQLVSQKNGDYSYLFKIEALSRRQSVFVICLYSLKKAWKLLFAWFLCKKNKNKNNQQQILFYFSLLFTFSTIIHPSEVNVCSVYNSVKVACILWKSLAYFSFKRIWKCLWHH